MFLSVTLRLSRLAHREQSDSNSKVSRAALVTERTVASHDECGSAVASETNRHHRVIRELDVRGRVAFARRKILVRQRYDGLV